MLRRNYVGGIERGERNVSLLNIVKLAHGLDCQADQIDRADSLTWLPSLTCL